MFATSRIKCSFRYQLKFGGPKYFVVWHEIMDDKSVVDNMSHYFNKVYDNVYIYVPLCTPIVHKTKYLDENVTVPAQILFMFT